MMALECVIDDSWECRWGIPKWEYQMATICIAAICERGRTIVVAADRELGINITSAEFHDGKWHPLFKDWSIAISGTVSNAMEVIKAAARLKKEMPSTAVWDVQDTIAKAYRQVRLIRAEALYLGNRGWTLEDYRKTGAANLLPTTYATIDAQISLFDFKTDLILAGFGEDDPEPSILTVTNPGVCIDHSKLGFWCVGSGATAAQMSLFAREYAWTFSAEKAAYYIYEAKVAAHNASGVGTTTDIYLIRPGGKIIPIQIETMKKLETIRQEIAPREYGTDHHSVLMNANEFSILRNLGP